MSSSPYLILALPRSRTAWLSVYMTWGPSICQHDGLGYGMAALHESLHHGETAFSGNADTLLGRFPDSVRSLGEMPVLVVRRPLAAVLDSAARYLGHPIEMPAAGILARQAALLEEIAAGHPWARAVEFHELSDPDILEGVWQHLTRHEAEPMPRQRLELLTRMNIQEPRSEMEKLPLARAMQ